jgi:hypothetical protein
MEVVSLMDIKVEFIGQVPIQHLLQNFFEFVSVVPGIFEVTIILAVFCLVPAPISLISPACVFFQKNWEVEFV